jgi:hypothetical protein
MLEPLRAPGATTWLETASVKAQKDSVDWWNQQPSLAATLGRFNDYEKYTDCGHIARQAAIKVSVEIRTSAQPLHWPCGVKI